MKYNKQLIKKVLQYLELSSMEPQEKTMWMMLLPKMEEKHIKKLYKSLKKEVNAITDLYLKLQTQ